MSKSMEYDIVETFDYFKKETHKLRAELSKEVKQGKIRPEDARHKYDMYRSMLIYLRVCLSMAESEDYLEDNSFSMRHLYARNEEKSSGDKKLVKAAKLMNS